MKYKGKSVEIIGSKTLTSSSCHPILGDAKMQNIVYQQIIEYLFFLSDEVRKSMGCGNRNVSTAHAFLNLMTKFGLFRILLCFSSFSSAVWKIWPI